MKNFILSTEQEIEIIKKKIDGISNSKLMEEYDIKYHLIYQILKRNGKDKPIANKRYEINENYFESINTEESAYWLGFLYADGYVRVHKCKDGTTDRCGELKLKLSINDKEHVELFKKCLNSTHKIKDIVSNTINGTKPSSSLCSTFSVYNIKLVQDLFKHGCVNNKTYKLKFPNLNENLIRHFIRGYFDGDGCVAISNCKGYCNKNGYTNINKIKMVHFTSGSLLFLQDIQKILFNQIETSNLKISLYKKAYRIMWYSKDDIGKIYNFFYKDATIFLDRKKNKFIEIFDSYEK